MTWRMCMSEKETVVDTSYLEEVAGQGFENMSQSEMAVPRLLIAQPLSNVVSNGTVAQGHFYNSITGKDYGTELRVIVCYFQKVWVEWKPDQGGYVGTYPIGGLEGVTGDNWTGMHHTGADGSVNDVVETWNYLVVLPDHMEDGYMIFGSTPGNLKYLKGWNTQLSYLRTPGGKPAPIFSAIWNMVINKDQNKKGNTFYSCNKDGKSSITQDSWVEKETFMNYVKPARDSAEQALALADNRVDVRAIEADSEESTAY